MKHLSRLTVLLWMLQGYTANAQGCSDAGFCTIANIKHLPALVADSGSNRLSFSVANGVGDDAVLVSTPTLQYDRQLGHHWALQAKATAGYASGRLGQTLGAGDLFVTGSKTFRLAKAWQLTVIAAVKFPLSQSNLRAGDKPLPMQYQSSLGTMDAIAGASLSRQRWQCSFAWQQPLTGANRNEYLPVYWPEESMNAYPPSNRLKRKGDVLGKISYEVIAGKKWHISAGLLGIYHLGRDSYETLFKERMDIAGSDGLTLNATLQAQWQFHPRWYIGLITGAPFVVRDVRPDGLTRAFVLSPELSYRF